MDGAQLDWSYAYKEKAIILQNETVCANAAKMPPEAWYEMYVKPWHLALARAGMCALSQVISASSCECNWSVHRHIHTKILNMLDPATTEKLVYVYSNSKLVASTCYADKLEMFAGDDEHVWVLHFLLVAARWTGPGPGREPTRKLNFLLSSMKSSKPILLSKFSWLP